MLIPDRYLASRELATRVRNDQRLQDNLTNMSNGKESKKSGRAAIYVRVLNLNR